MGLIGERQVTSKAEDDIRTGTLKPDERVGEGDGKSTEGRRERRVELSDESQVMSKADGTRTGT